MDTAIQKIPILIKRSSLLCNCEKLTNSQKHKICTICDICSEKKFIRDCSKTKINDKNYCLK